MEAMRWFVLALILTGCANMGTVVLTHSRTGQTVECRDQVGQVFTHIQRCVKAYEQSGYTITGDTR
jgi:hypothetical protein